jgi:hypothetical protein
MIMTVDIDLLSRSNLCQYCLNKFQYTDLVSIGADDAATSTKQQLQQILLLLFCTTNTSNCYTYLNPLDASLNLLY